MGAIRNGQGRLNPERTRFQNGHDPEWKQFRMDTIPNVHNSERAHASKYIFKVLRTSGFIKEIRTNSLSIRKLNG